MEFQKSNMECIRRLCLIWLPNVFMTRQTILNIPNLKNYRKSLLENKNTIEVTDFGAGSRVFKAINEKLKNC
jgi:hypothetical protein